MTVTEPEPTPDIAPADANTRPEGENALAWPSTNDIPDFEEEAPEAETQEPAEPEAPETQEPATTEPETPEVPAGDGFEALPESWQAKVTELREESKNYRLRAKEFHEAFEGYDEATRDKFLDMARGLADESRHVEVAKEFVLTGQRVLEAYGLDLAAVADDPNRPLTVKELEAREAKQAEERAIAESVAKIAKEVEELGYVEGSPDHYALLRIANDDPNGDLKAAHEKLQAHGVEKAKALLASDAGADLRKQVIEDFITAVRQKQQTHLPTTPATGVAPSDPGDEPVTDFGGTRARMEQFLSDFQG